ncbi:hypothetical protein DPX16_6656 [Anabarilius grahami]|uniref:Ig-like domain-containing protein n=1 Tax=Anabarilius grahami TaxID=495550 RepID=A0A3N0YQL1_ANAGA|nr:hypothetical protein DPX16_6656 [Anabarilius grahami]
MTVAEVTCVFSSSGENVRLPCNNALSDCTSTTWNYNTRDSETVELIAGGIKRNDRERHERLSVGSDCSLNIKKVTQEDFGIYTCRQYVNGQQQGTDAPVYLHFLHVSSSSSQTEIRPGSSVTLYCQLYHYEVDCDYFVRSEGLQLVWVNQAGVSVMTDSRYQILFSSTHCVSTLTTTLLNEDLNTEWRCQVTQRNQLKTSATYTVKYSTVRVHDVIFVMWRARSRPHTPAAHPVRAQPKFRDRADGARATAHAQEQKDDVTYTEVFTYSKNQAKKNKVHGEDKVTYASIRGATAGPQDNSSQLYASVNKNCDK